MLCYYAVCYYAKCRILFMVMMNAIKLSVIVLNVVAQVLIQNVLNSCISIQFELKVFYNFEHFYPSLTFADKIEANISSCST